MLPVWKSCLKLAEFIWIATYLCIVISTICYGTLQCLGSRGSEDDSACAMPLSSLKCRRPFSKGGTPNIDHFEPTGTITSGTSTQWESLVDWRESFRRKLLFFLIQHFFGQPGRRQVSKTFLDLSIQFLRLECMQTICGKVALGSGTWSI